MKCPHCGALDNRVINSRLTSDETSIRRRRECDACHQRFTTFEHIERTPLVIVKRDGTRQGFDREKIVRGLLRACEKRPVTMEQIEELVARIERELQSEMEREISSMRVGEMILTGLRGLDEVAYVRFASVYRQFRDVAEFSHEVRSLLGGMEGANESPDGGESR